MACGISHPAHNPDAFEASEVCRVGGDEYQVVGVRDRGDLTVNERRHPAERCESRPLSSVPLSTRLVVLEYRHASGDYILQVALDRRTSAGRS